jgi:hypothetical protein
VWKCALWIERSFEEIIPMTKLFQHPISYCAIVYSRTIGGRLRTLEHSVHAIEPIPRKYRWSNTFKLMCVPLVSIHVLTSFIKCRNTAARSESGHQAMCLHVSLQLLLGTWGFSNLDMTEISSFLQFQGRALPRPKDEIVAVGGVGCSCGWTSS